MKTALLLIDIQNDYFPGGSMELVGSTEASEQAQKLLAHFRASDRPVIHVQHFSVRPGASFFVPDTPGVDIHDNVAPLAGEVLVQKHYPNSFRETVLLEHLRKEGIERLAVAGMMTSMCVDATVRAAFDYGLQNVVFHDATATRDLAFGDETIPARQVHGAFLAALGAVYAKVTGVDEFLSEL